MNIIESSLATITYQNIEQYYFLFTIKNKLRLMLDVQLNKQNVIVIFYKKIYQL
jgi:hypothetical protein